MAQSYFRKDWQPRKEGFGSSYFEPPKKQPQPRQKKSGKGGFLTSLISEGSGLGGALGGAALGTAILPGVGTLVGAGLGGFLGGAGGSAVEQKVRDDDVNLGKALKEGAIEGVLSAGPLKLGKAALAGGRTLAQGAGSKAALSSMNEAATRPGMLSRVGQTLRGEGRGVGVGEKLAGSRIGPDKSKDINAFLEKTVKIGGGSAAKQLEALEPFIKTQSGQLSDAIAKSNRALTATDKKNITDLFKKSFADGIIGATSRQKGIADDLLARIGQSKDIKSLDDVRKVVDDNINFARNTASPEPAAEQVYKMFRRILTDDVANKVGAAKGLKSNIAKAFDAEELLLNRSAKSGSGISPAGITLPGRASQSLQSMGGRSLGKLGAALDSRGKVATGARIVAGSTLANGAPQPPVENTLETALMGQMGANQLPGNMGNPNGLSSALPESQQNPYSQENLVADMQRDPENADKYFDYYTMLQEVYSPTGSTKPLSAEASKVIANANSGLQSLGQLEQMIGEGGVPKATVLPGRNLFGGLGAAATGTSEYDTVSRNIVDVITRLRTGAALTESEEQFYKSQIPQAFDDPATIQTKLAMFRDLFGSVANRTGSAGTDMQSALGAY